MKKVLNIMKEKRKNIFYCFIIALVGVIELSLILLRGRALFTTSDFYKQYIVIPNYFRNLFYTTHDLFPNFALHIGGGQNIFYFAYYGLFSPIILLSYLFPFIDMLDYIIIFNVLHMIISGILLYYFLKMNNFTDEQSLFGALLLMTSCSFLCHSTRHMMYIDYMSFFIISLMGVEKYHDGNNSALLMIGLALIILTSFYFSIPCIILLVLYYWYLLLEQKTNLKEYLIRTLKFFLRIMVPVLMTSFFLLPTAGTLFARISTSNAGNIMLSDLLTLSVSSDALFFCKEGIGLDTMVLIALIFNILYMPRRNKVIASIVSILLFVPLFNYLLNGTLYIAIKIFIPFLPIIILLITDMIKNINKIKAIHFIIITIIFNIIFFLFIGRDVSLEILFKNLLVNIVLLFVFSKRKKIIYLLPIIFFSCLFAVWQVSYSAKQAPLSLYHTYKENLEKLNSSPFLEFYRTQVNGDEFPNFSNANILLPTIYSSISNTYYNEAFHTKFYSNYKGKNNATMNALKNPFYLRFMGVKYIYSNEDVYGYQHNDSGLLINENVFPIGFFRNNILNVKEYNELNGIQKLQAYQNNIVIDGESDNPNLEFIEDEIAFSLDEVLKDNLEYKVEDNHYIFETEDIEFTYNLNKPLKDKTLIIRFNINNNPSCDDGAIITINGDRNVLLCNTHKYFGGNHPFNYVITGNTVDKLEIKLNKGYYDISDLEIYAIDNSFFESLPDGAIEIDLEKTRGDDIVGSITVEEEGYVLFTIPYDKGFELTVDGNKKEIEMVNEAFIGFPIEEGKHVIEIHYTSPYSIPGKHISVVGLFAFVVMLYNERKYHQAN